MSKKYEEYLVVGGRCKEHFYLSRHRVIKIKGRGYRCKYCDKILSDLRYGTKIKKRKKK